MNRFMPSKAFTVFPVNIKRHTSQCYY